MRIIEARHKGIEYSPDNAKIVEPILYANWLMMGPGSPTYAVRQLAGSLAYQYSLGMHLSGSALSLASAGVLALSAYTLPVYEIYKAGEDLHWQKGLNYFANFGLGFVLIPH